jgi:hypothetical protein
MRLSRPPSWWFLGEPMGPLKLPRFKIRTLMLILAVLAFDMGVILHFHRKLSSLNEVRLEAARRMAMPPIPSAILGTPSPPGAK